MEGQKVALRMGGGEIISPGGSSPVREEGREVGFWVSGRCGGWVCVCVCVGVWGGGSTTGAMRKK